MKNTTLDHIKKTVLSTLKEKYEYCDLTDSDTVALLNSGGEGEIVIILIENASESDAEKAAKEQASERND